MLGLGGIEIISNGYKYHKFISSSSFTALQSGNIEIIVVAGGGGGGSFGGGGGAGGLKYNAAFNIFVSGSYKEYVITIGEGGNGDPDVAGTGTKGGDTTFGTDITATGGGGGGSRIGSVPWTGVNGATGGSGGGGSCSEQVGGGGTGGAADPGGEGYAGGNVSGGTGYWGSAGGGGAGELGHNGVTTTGGNGGAGLSTYSSMLSVVSAGENIGGTYWIAGGGGGASYSSGIAGIAGEGGGGAGSKTGVGVAGTANTGGGGGGGTYLYSGGKGGSGIVIIRYPYPPVCNYLHARRDRLNMLGVSTQNQLA